MNQTRTTTTVKSSSVRAVGRRMSRLSRQLLKEAIFKFEFVRPNIDAHAWQVSVLVVLAHHTQHEPAINTVKLREGDANLGLF